MINISILNTEQEGRTIPEEESVGVPSRSPHAWRKNDSTLFAALAVQQIVQAESPWINTWILTIVPEGAAILTEGAAGATSRSFHAWSSHGGAGTDGSLTRRNCNEYSQPHEPGASPCGAGTDGSLAMEHT